MQVTNGHATNGHKGHNGHHTTTAGIDMPPAAPTMQDEVRMAVEDKPLPHLHVAIYDYLVEANETKTTPQIADAMAKLGYKHSSVSPSITMMKANGVLTEYGGAGNHKDPYQLWLADDAVRPPEKPWKPANKKTKAQRAEEEYRKGKEIHQKFSEAEKRQINNTPKQIPTGTNNSLASEMHRLHIGETQLQPGVESRPLPGGAIGKVTSVSVATEVETEGPVQIASNTGLLEILKNSQFKLSWRGQEITFEEAFKMKEELEAITNILSGK